MTAKYIGEKLMNAIINELHPANALAMRVALATGARLTDVLRLDTLDLVLGATITITECKTDKKRKISIPQDLRLAMLAQAGPVFVFTHAKREDRHRTRQAVYKDVKRACRRLNVDPRGISPHSARKCYAVRLLRSTGDLRTVQCSLNHASKYTTIVYAHSDKF